MSEPITRAFMLRLAEVLHDPDELGEHWRNQMADAITIACNELVAYGPAEPRVPVGITGPVLPYESGPGQPTDIVERLDEEAMRLEHMGRLVDEYLSKLMRQSSAEITRLRADAKMMGDALALMPDMEKAAREKGRRAGIEEALEAVRQAYVRNGHLGAKALAVARTAIRALAAAPPVDPLLAGLEHVRKNMESIHGWDLLNHLAWLDSEIAARKGG